MATGPGDGESSQLLGGQYGPGALAVGATGIYWFECGAGVLWRASFDGSVSQLATVDADASRYTHGCPDRGIATDEGFVVWAHTAGSEYEIRLSYAAEDGSSSGEVAKFEQDYGIPGGLVVIGTIAYVVLFGPTESAGEDGGVIVKTPIFGGESAVLWDEVPLFLGRDGGRPIWGDKEGAVYTEKRGRAHKLRGRSGVSTAGMSGASRYLVTNRGLLWIEDGQAQSVAW